MFDTTDERTLPIATPTVRDVHARALRELRISVIDRCNLRCTYCMPADGAGKQYAFLPRQEVLGADEIVRLARVFVARGVHKLRITGGEPLLRADLVPLVRELAALPGVDDLALTTNGTLLPGLAEALREAGLGRITVSLDTLDPEVMHAMTGDLAEVEQVLAGIEAAERAGFPGLKINTVVQRGVNDHTVMDLLAHFRGTGHTVRLIEYMDVGTRNHWRREQVVPSAEWRERIHARWPIRALPRHAASATANRYAYVDGQGEIGFISSVSEPFCGACTRARLTADGTLYTCLFAARGMALRPLLREAAGDETIAAAIDRAWRRRDDRYSEQRSVGAPETDRVEMYRVGG